VAEPGTAAPGGALLPGSCAAIKARTSLLIPTGHACFQDRVHSDELITSGDVARAG
jgi:hypothetical protein